MNERSGIGPNGEGTKRAGSSAAKRGTSTKMQFGRGSVYGRISDPSPKQSKNPRGRTPTQKASVSGGVRTTAKIAGTASSHGAGPVAATNPTQNERKIDDTVTHLFHAIRAPAD